MALVRRPVSVGRAHVPAHAPYPAYAAPAPPGPAPAAPAGGNGGLYGAPAGWDSENTNSMPVTGAPASPGMPPLAASPGFGPAPAYDPNTATAPTLPAHPLAVLGGFGIAAIGGLTAMGIGDAVTIPPFRVEDQVSAFGALLVFAGAVERVLEPITRWMPGRKPQERYERALADMDNGVPGATQIAAVAKAACERARASRGVLMWGIATALATVLSSSAGFYLLRALNADTGWNAVPTWVDAMVTGLIVGSGTKPLHDLITKVQKPKEGTAA
ncbi:hypothetical protein GCM10009682_41430 [Luedemannella flava]|uniref:Uncharacterized protein n=1 Tax=Luedemannella flava TaxID=349316 RepID=A0ABP4YNI8_9ACTN